MKTLASATPLAMALLTAWLVCAWSVSGMAVTGAMPSTVASMVALTFVPYGLLLWHGGERFPLSIRALLVLAFVAGLPAVFAPTVLSDDVFRYVWDGHVAGAFVDPYAYAPSSPAIAHLRDELWQHINNPTVPTIYPPVSQALFVFADAVAHHPASFKALALLMHLAIAWRLAQEADVRVAATWALNPLALFESSLSGHVDVFAGAFALMMIVALVRARPSRAAVYAVLAAGVKLIGLLLLPLVAAQRRSVALLAVPFALLCVIPLAHAGYGDSEVAGLTHYAGRWEGNAGPYRAVEATFRTGLEAAAGTGGGRIEVPALAPLLDLVAETPLDPWRSFEREKKPFAERWSMDSHILSSWLARLFVLLGLLVAAAILVRRRVAPMIAARNLLFLALLFAPQVHPWYLLWLLPLEAYAGKRAGFVWSAIVLIAYFPLDGWVQAREWVEPVWLSFIEYSLVFIALWQDRDAPSRPCSAGQVGDPQPAGQTTGLVERPRHI